MAGSDGPGERPIASGGVLQAARELAAVLREFRCLTNWESRKLFLDFMSDELRTLLPISQNGVTHHFLLELARVSLYDARIMRALRNTLAVLEENSRALQQLDAVLPRVTVEPASSPDAIDELHALLAELEVPGLTRLCRQAAGEFQTVPPLSDPRQAFDVLSTMNAQPNHPPPGLALVEYLAAEAPSDTASALRAWADRQARALSLTAQLRELRQRVVPAGPAQPADACLVIRLLRQDEDGRYQLTAWRQYDPEGWRPVRGQSMAVTLGDAERVVQDLVWEAAEEWAEDAESIHVEFLLGTDDLTLPVHQWRQELDSAYATPLSMEYPVVVRSLERSQTRRWHRQWRQRWNLLTTQPERARRLVVDDPESDVPDAEDPGVLEAQIKADRHLVAMVLSSPPKSTAQGTHEARAAWRAGLPVVVWDQRDPRSPDLIHQLTGDLARLRETVTELRLRAHTIDSAEREQHVGKHLVLVWDDPTRPVETRGRLSGPEQGADSR